MLSTKEKRQQAIASSRSFHLAKKLKIWLDDYYLDGIIGLFPIVGDIVTQLFNLVFVYISVVKIRSVRLTIVLIFNSLIDVLIGLIPYLGMVLDFFHKSFKKNLDLIEKFVQQDKATVQKINKQTAWAIAGCLGGIICIVLLIRWLIGMFDYFTTYFD